MNYTLDRLKNPGFESITRSC